MLPGVQIARGIVLATLAALLFGVTVPFLKLASDAGVGAWPSAALLYLGAAAGAGITVLLRHSSLDRALLARRALLRLGVVAACGAVLAPVLLVLGVKRTDAATTSLLLTLEMPFTLVLARLFYGEHLGRRALMATLAILAGSLVLAGRLPGTGSELWGVIFVAGATLAWGLDNVISRALADHDPLAVVILKGLMGGSASAVLAVVSGQAAPPLRAASAIFLIGVVGYGFSLQLYLRAQTLVGAARTASVFAAAPFAGTVVSLLLGSPWPGVHLPVSAVLLMVGVALHLSERHSHRHIHDPLVHEHLHTHDDAHHTHQHEPPVQGAHSHPHAHAEIEHEHDHGDDIHHRHRH